MLYNRIIPCLLYKDDSLVKTIKIYNSKEVDELIFLDINASNENKEPNYKIIKKIASECFMPLAYGGGVNSYNIAKKIFKLGIEKISLNTAAINNPKLIKQLSKTYGNQSIIISIDTKKNLFGKYEVYTRSGTQNTHINILDHIKKCEKYGAGELLITSIDREGTWSGYDLKLIKLITQNTNLPVIVLGGAGKLDDFYNAIKEGASAVAAGSMFVYQHQDMGVLINYPSIIETKKILRYNNKS